LNATRSGTDNKKPNVFYKAPEGMLSVSLEETNGITFALLNNHMNSFFTMKSLSSILLVDADPILVSDTIDLLGREGYSVEAVKTGHEAITRVKQKRFGAVLLDVDVQEKNMLSVIHALASLDPFLSIVILITSVPSEKNDEWVKPGTLDFLRKPFKGHELKETLQRLWDVRALRRIAENTVSGLMTSGERYRSIVETARDAIILGDLDGKILSWNKAAEHMFGYSADEIVSKSLTSLMPVRYREQHKKGLERVRSTHETRVIGNTVELHGLRKSGEEFPIELSLSRSVESNEQFFCGIIRDITDRKRMAAQLLEEAKLAEVARVLGDITHDIKNMLMPVLNGATLLKEELRDHFQGWPNINRKQVEATKKITTEAIELVIKNTRRVHDRVREIADTVKGKTSTPRFGPCQISGVVKAVLESLRLYSIEKRVSLRTQELDSLPLILADENRLFNALYNLVNNAIPETPYGGSVTIGGRVGSDQTTIMISVTDTGNGMRPEIRDSLFTNETISQKIGGTGLGTKIVKDVVDVHGGTITVESEQGNGTTFTIKLPVNATALRKTEVRNNPSKITSTYQDVC